jgi:hypothetical protein
MLVAPLVLQLSVLLDPTSMLEEPAAKEFTVGRLVFVGLGVPVTPAQLAKPISVASTVDRITCGMNGRRDRHAAARPNFGSRCINPE